MGRGRKGVLDQSEKGKSSQGASRARRGESMGHFIGVPKREEKKILINEDALDFIKNMNQQELVNILLSDDWHVKTSGINASGN